MQNKISGQTAEINELDGGLFSELNDGGSGEELANDSGATAGDDADAMVVSLKKAVHNGEDCIEVYAHGYTYPEDGSEKVERVVLLARVTEKELVMFPLVSASYRGTFLAPKYGRLSTIRILAEEYEPWWLPDSISEFDGMLESLPVGFGRHAKYGLGLKWEYRLIPQAILKVPSVTELVIAPGDAASIQGTEFRLGIDHFSAIRRSIDSITKRAQTRSLRDRQLLAFNELLHFADPARFERQFAKVRPGEIYQLVKLGGRTQSRSPNDRLAAVAIIQDDVVEIAKERPSQLLELKSVIEQVTLKELIAKIEEMLKGNLTEPKWQAFFKANPFVIGLAFPYPVIMIQDQAHVGGTTLRGVGESVADFLFAQRFTGNLALVEIKRPSTHLLEAKPFRGDLYAPHKDLTSAMAQVLDQRFQLHSSFTAKALDPLLKDTHVSAVHCVVIAGTAPSDIEKKRSLDLFRNSSRDVVVVTFDELLDKLREILRLITSEMSVSEKSAGAVPSSLPLSDDDLPF